VAIHDQSAARGKWKVGQFQDTLGRQDKLWVFGLFYGLLIFRGWLGSLSTCLPLGFADRSSFNRVNVESGATSALE
jgi:hypothetical protein